MGKLLSKKADESQPKKSVVSLTIAGSRYSNAAAKFWASLFDEICEDYPDCTLIELSAPCSGHLDADHLYPQRALEKDLESLTEGDVGDMMREAIAEIELLGAPPPVRVRLMNGTNEILSIDIPLDCMDAETFPCLVVWPMRWAGIPEAAWNCGSVSGTFEAEDKRRKRFYSFEFEVANRHMSEGLYRRLITGHSSVRSADKVG